MNAALFGAVLVLQMPEWWHQWFGIDVWEADQIALGATVTILSGMLWKAKQAVWPVCLLAGLFCTSRSVCTIAFPDASDSSGSICDLGTGLPLTMAALALALWALGRAR